VKYQNTNSVGTPLQDRSQFTQCTFEVNDDMSQQSGFTYHVSMWGVDGIKFYGCAFTNLQTDPNVPNEKAIYTLDADYTLFADCGNTSSIPCNALSVIRTED